MKRTLIPASCCLFLLSCAVPARQHLFNTSGTQVVEVLAVHADSVAATMLLWERVDSTRDWTLADSFPVTLGRNGLAPSGNIPGHKLEGDGNSPSGVFRLSSVFSYHALTGLQMPLEVVDENDLCVDDVHSRLYNQLVDDDTVVVKDYQSFERMRRVDLQYEFGVWVDYNTAPAIPGWGSCIFLHVWKEPGAATSGCTAMSKENMLKLIYWLRADADPVLVQSVR